MVFLVIFFHTASLEFSEDLGARFDQLGETIAILLAIAELTVATTNRKALFAPTLLSSFSTESSQASRWSPAPFWAWFSGTGREHIWRQIFIQH
ncbi:MAG: hypothetical protein OEY88_01855 [Candidatus Bathyarchaeota archaeon]|nr:hypothetical protein [Candidatus Bathyarchaeota archaeon]